jgi:hypothetical protein
VEPARAPGAVDLGRAHMVEKGGGKARQNPGAAQAMATRTARGRRRLREEGGDGCEKREVDAANRMRAIGANRAGYGRQKRDENAYYRRNHQESERISVDQRGSEHSSENLAGRQQRGNNRSHPRRTSNGREHFEGRGYGSWVRSTPGL